MGKDPPEYRSTQYIQAMITKEEVQTKKQITESLWVRHHAITLEISRELENIEGLKKILGGVFDRITLDTIEEKQNWVDTLIKRRKALEEARSLIYYNFGW